MTLQITFHHLQALVAVADMGSFEAAGDSLGIAQSAVSKHIRGFESRFPFPLLDRTERAARLTLEGSEVLAQARYVLRQRDVLLEQLGSPLTMKRSLRIGVTEIAAMTWLPRFVGVLKAHFPLVELRLEIGGVAWELYDKVRRGQLEMAMVSDSPQWSGLLQLPLGSMRCGWFRLRSFEPQLIRCSVKKLADYPLLIQDTDSAFGRWMLTCNSFAALGGMATAGMGIGCLPLAVSNELVSMRLVKEVKITPALPVVRYVVVAREESMTPFHREVAAIARDSCDYNKRYQNASIAGPKSGFVE
ncbi:LysR family transcriptional regulator [Cupriavidus basilensis OR16]|uniref:LysR family transcriptional regulator n=1 Tax=Cupriavidus basilensis OR16 TaxID=1127483 RepID=H1S1U5_9BURK|nr:LysR family transcriptional regulator [Cupriavidus basilensis]EHP43439.1 LysR family transcriptional regulator [Cupriavidus basilensis OR16]